VDLTTPDELPLSVAIAQAKQEAERLATEGLSQDALDEAARAGFGAAAFEVLEEEGLQVVEEFLPEPEQEQHATGEISPAGQPTLREKLAQRQQATG
jgi:hypothetical protein